MLKALGSIGIKVKKKVPATDGQIEKYQREKRLRDQWRYDAESIASITAHLRQKYSLHKGDFAMGRYEELKAMIKEAIQEHGQLQQRIKERSSQKSAALLEKYSNNAGSANNNHDTEPKRGAGAITSLNRSAAGFAGSAPGAEDSGAVYDMSVKDIEEELSKFRSEVLSCKATFREETARLERLATEYQASKRQAPPQRYQAMKGMVKAVTRGEATG